MADDDHPVYDLYTAGRRLLHEGDAVAPGLVLLSIGPKSALLRYRETRFTVSY